MTALEHANITVPDIDSAIRFIKTVASDFRVKRDEKHINGYRWVHIGNDHYYLALQEPHLDATPKDRRSPYRNYGINHLAFVVDNIEEIESKLLENGYKRGIGTPKEKYRKRAYFFDDAGLEWELVEYLSENPEEKYLYE